jgi:cytidylate kinase
VLSALASTWRRKIVDAPRRRRPIVAIDGPAGAGKSTVARRLAEALDFVLVDTGALYRAVALAAQRSGVDWSDRTRLGELARSLVARNALVFERGPDRGGRVLLDGDDVTGAIRAPEIGMGASNVSAFEEVRDALLDLQRQAGSAGGVVLEGRDIGTVVFPRAEVKFFLTARPDVRARRRFEELIAKGTAVTFEETLDDVHRRDKQDTTRAVAPLRQAVDAILVDDSEMSIDDTVRRMVECVRRRDTT